MHGRALGPSPRGGCGCADGASWLPRGVVRYPRDRWAARSGGVLRAAQHVGVECHVGSFESATASIVAWPATRHQRNDGDDNAHHGHQEDEALDLRGRGAARRWAGRSRQISVVVTG